MKALILLALFLPAVRAFAAPCCGGNFAIPSLIAGDEKAQLTTSLSTAQSDRDVLPNGEWVHRSEPETMQTLKIEAAHVFADRWQVNGAVPVLARERAGRRSTGLADLQLGLGYEALPDWDYNPYRPKAIVFSSLTAPTGKSSFEAEDEFGLEARGQGFWALGAGVLLTKTIRLWDFNASLEAHRSFEKRVSRSSFEGTLTPGWGGTLTLGAGFNQGSLRLGASLANSYEDPVQSRGTVDSDGALKRFTTASLTTSYLIDDDWAVTGAYADQSWFGSPVNTSLNQSLTLLLQRRWAR